MGVEFGIHATNFAPLTFYVILRWQWDLRQAATFLAEIVSIFQLLAWVTAYMWGPAVMSYSLLLHDRPHHPVTWWTMYQMSLVLSQSDTDPYTVEVCWSQDMRFYLIPSASLSFSFFPQKVYIYLSFHFTRAIYPSHRRDTIVHVLTNPVYL
jgi:hypothetical protein